MSTILAQFAGHSLVEILIIVVIVAACVGIAYIALRQFGMTIPAFVIQIFWILVCAFCAIAAIKMVASF